MKTAGIDGSFTEAGGAPLVSYGEDRGEVMVRKAVQNGS